MSRETGTISAVGIQVPLVEYECNRTILMQRLIINAVAEIESLVPPYASCLLSY